MAERLATILPNETVTDAKVIQEYYFARHKAVSTMIAYGAEIERRPDPVVRRWRVEHPEPDEEFAQAVEESGRAIRPPHDPW